MSNETQPQGMVFGYSRVSTTEQDQALQEDALIKARVDQIFTDTAFCGSSASVRLHFMALPVLYGLFMASSDRKGKRLTAAVVWLPMEHYAQTWQLVWNYNDTDLDGQLIITGTMSPTVRPVGDFKTTKKASRDAGWYVSVRWEYIKDGWVPVGLGIESNQGERIGAEHLRTIRTGEVIEASIWPLRALKALQVVGGDIDVRSLEKWALPEQHLGRKRSYDDDHWRHVAEVVKREQFSGNTKWVQAVQEQVPDADGYRPTTAQAKRWVQRAREMGLL